MPDISRPRTAGSGCLACGAWPARIFASSGLTPLASIFTRTWLPPRAGWSALSRESPHRAHQRSKSLTPRRSPNQRFEVLVFDAASVTCAARWTRSDFRHELLSLEPPGSIVIPFLSPTTPDHDTVGVLFSRLELHLPIGIRQITATLGACARVVLGPQKHVDWFTRSYPASLRDISNRIFLPANLVCIKRVEGGEQRTGLLSDRGHCIVLLLPGQIPR